MFDNTFSAAAAWDGDPDAAGLMMRDLSTGMWVEYDPLWSPEDVDVVPLEVLLDDEPAEPGMDELDDWDDAPAPFLDELPVDTDDRDSTDTDEGASGHADDDEGTSDRDADARGPVPVPDGLTSMPPGPDLATTLANISVRRVSGYDTVDVMAAAYRQECHARAVFLQALLETGMRQPGSVDTVSRVDHPGEFAAEEARIALVWSRRRADGTFEFAFDIHERLPMLGQAMLDGVLDEPRARAFTQWTTGLSDDQAGHIITTLLPAANTLPVGELVDRIKRLAIAIDPEWAQRRYRAAVKGRRVEGSRNDDGTANIAGLDLPVDRAAAACDRIDVLARACKHAGDSRPVDHVRTDLYLGMLDGTFEHLTENEIIAYVLTHPFTDTDGDGDGPGDGGAANNGDTGPDDGDDGPSGTGPTDDDGTGGGGTGPAGRDGGNGPSGGDGGSSDGDGGSPSGGTDPTGRDGHDDDTGGSASGSDIDTGPGDDPAGRHDGGGGSDPAIDPRPDPDSDHGHRGGDGTGSAAATQSGAEVSRGHAGDDDPQATSCRPGATAPATRTPGSAAPVPTKPGPATPGPAPPGSDRSRSQPAESEVTGWSVRELRVEIATLLGLNEHPAEIVGWDYIPATLARTLIPSMRGGQWRWVVCDQHGHPIDSGITRRRPHPPPGAGGTGQRPPPRDAGRRAGIVELQLRADDLPTLTAATIAAGPHHAWARVIADIAAQHRATDTADDDSEAAGEDDATDTVTDDADGVDVTGTAGEDDAAGAAAMRDAHRRSARAGLRRWVQIRDRSCVHPSCRMPASRTDQDHATDHADGGPTTGANLGSACRHDHRVKHDGGWRIWKPTPDTTIWASPLGHTYTNRPPPIMPALPKPWPATYTNATAAAAPSPEPGQITTTDIPPF